MKTPSKPKRDPDFTFAFDLSTGHYYDIWMREQVMFHVGSTCFHYIKEESRTLYHKIFTFGNWIKMDEKSFGEDFVRKYKEWQMEQLILGGNNGENRTDS